MTDSNDKLTSPAPSGVAQVYDYSGIAGTGFENTSEKDLATPFIELLQQNSKKATESSPKYVPGARPGMFLNTGTGELIPGKPGFAFVPLHVDHCVVEWSAERAFVARHPIDAQLFKDALARYEANTDPNKTLSKDVKSADGKNQLVETYYVWALLLAEDGITPTAGVILSFKSTGIAVYRNQLYTPLYQFKGAGGKLFVHRMRATTTTRQGTKGDSISMRIEPLKGSIRDSLIDPASELFQAVLKSYENVRAGKVKMAAETADHSDGAAAPVDEVFS